MFLITLNDLNNYWFSDKEKALKVREVVNVTDNLRYSGPSDAWLSKKFDIYYKQLQLPLGMSNA